MKDGTDPEAITKASTALSDAMQKIGEAMAKEASTHEGDAAKTDATEEPKKDEGEAPKVHDV